MCDAAVLDVRRQRFVDDSLFVAAFPNVSLAPVRPRPGQRGGSAASVHPLSTIVGAK
jgi:hypothetical protein